MRGKEIVGSFSRGGRQGVVEASVLNVRPLPSWDLERRLVSWREVGLWSLESKCAIGS